MKVITIVGARPQLIKASVVSHALKRSGIAEELVHTGQHFDKNMSDVFFKELRLPKPACNLNIHSLGHGAMTGRMMEQIEKILIRKKPRAVIVYGDTNSTLAGALAAKKLHIPLVHVEAGLRSHNRYMPEEINRVVTDRISDILFCPTRLAVRNLTAEGFREFDCRIVNCGDVMFDAALHFIKLAKLPSRTPVAGKNDSYVLCSLHREENTSDPRVLSSIINALNLINREVPVVMPMHPRTRMAVKKWKIKVEFMVREPAGYLDMLALTSNSRVVMTDSGGLQKEAYFFKKPCVTLRYQTEWRELVDHGYNMTAGTDTRKIISCFREMSKRKSRLGFKHRFYGTGKASDKIASVLKSSFS